jgi:16S rRNA (uracil1498-N3)-methyltransferase
LRNEQQISKLDRWNRITTEAARQCGRPDIPEVSWKKDAVEASSESDHVLRLILWEGEKKYFLKDALSAGEKLSTVIIAIGPEGGFDPQELHCFTEQGFLPVSLGSRILRTETASIAILSIIQYISGEM